jgi:hypothetical protein
LWQILFKQLLLLSAWVYQRLLPIVHSTEKLDGTRRLWFKSLCTTTEQPFPTRPTVCKITDKVSASGYLHLKFACLPAHFTITALLQPKSHQNKAKIGDITNHYGA